MKYDICALGEILIDMSPIGNDASGDPKFAAKAGGAPLNLLATASKFGMSTVFIGKVGDDVFGRQLKDTINTCGIDSAGLITDGEHNTTLAIVKLDETGDRDFSFYRRHGADIFISPEEINEALISSSQIFHFGSLSLTDEPARSATEKALSIAKESGCIISYDPNYRAPLWDDEKTASKMIKKHLDKVDIMKISRDELEMIELNEKDLIDTGITALIVSDGKNGADIHTKEGSAHIDARPSSTIDTTGAGDILFGSFLTAFSADRCKIDTLTLQKATGYLSVAVQISGISTETKGAIASIPDRSVFDRAMAQTAQTAQMS